MPEQLEIYEELKIINNEIAASYKKLLEYKLNNDHVLFYKELKDLKLLFDEENIALQALDIDEIINILEEYEIGMLRNLHSIFDKFYTIAFLCHSFEEEFDFRLMNNVRDASIFNDRISKFNDVDIYDTDEEYDDKMLNTLVVEFQLFNDLLELFICVINEYIESTDNNEVKSDLITYKYILAFVYGKNNFHLLDDNLNSNNTFCYSKLVYDMLLQCDREVAYNYDIIKYDYLDKALHVFFSEIYSIEILSATGVEKIIQACYCKAMLMLYGNDYENARRIYLDCKKENIKLEYIDEVFNDCKNIASKSKVLTLRK